MNIIVGVLFVGFVACVPSQRIVDGSDATSDTQFPWQVSLQYESNGEWFHTCGGTLIKSDRVLTAAHCWTLGLTYRVSLGSRNRNTPLQTIAVSDFIRNPDYDGNANGFPNDIAVLKLSSNANIGPTIEAIKMAEKGQDFSGEKCIISGWGYATNGTGISLPSILQYVSMNQIEQSECISQWGPKYIFNTHICVYEPPKSACNGDSGGPMVCDGVLAGVTSWGLVGCYGTLASVYTRVSEFLDWVNAQ